MPKISKEEQKVQEEKNCYYSRTFTTMFTNEKLTSIYEEEIKNIPNWELISKMLLKQEDAKDEHFTPYIPKSIRYIKENIFHSADGDFYMSSWTPESGFYAKEYTDVVLTKTYTKYFTKILKKWFETYSRVYTLICNTQKPRIYEIGGVHFLNMFSGYPLDIVPRDHELIKKYAPDIKFYWSHVKENLCSNNIPVFELQQQWTYSLIGGKRKMKICPYMMGQGGTGKGEHLNLHCNILGPQNCVRVNNANDILGQFNGHLAGKMLVIIDDVKLNFEQYNTLYGQLKTYISEDTMAYRDLYKRSLNLPNSNSIIISANENMIKRDANEGEQRRIMFMDINHVLRSKDYYTRLHELVANIDFQKAFLWHCQDNYNPEFREMIDIKKLPLTESYQRTALQSITPSISFFKALLVEPEETFNKPQKPSYLYNELYIPFYKNYTKKEKVPQYTDFTREIKKFEFVQFKENMRYGGSTGTTYVIANKDKCVAVLKKQGYLSDIEIEDLHIKPKTKYDLLLQETQRMKELQKDMREAQEAFLKLSQEIMEKKRQEEEKKQPLFTEEDENRAKYINQQNIFRRKNKMKVLDFVPKSKDEVLDMMSLRLF